MIAIRLTILLVMTAPQPDPKKSAAADAVTLRTGEVILGQLADPADRGEIALIVRRAWAAKERPELLKRWEAEEPDAGRARAGRRRRLEAWKRERSAVAGPGDRILDGIGRELARLDRAGAGDRTPLLVVTLKRADVRQVKRAPDGSGRLLRLAWICAFPAAEASTREELVNSLEDRGFDPAGRDPVTIDHLLPIPIEGDGRWLLRRAATEATSDPGASFAEMGPMLVPDMGGRMAGVRAGFGFPGPPDPQADDGATVDRLAEAAPRGRVGALVSRQETDVEQDAATVTVAFFVRRPDGSWTPQIRRSATVRAAEITKEDEEGPGSGSVPRIAIAFSQSFNIDGQTFQRSYQSSPRLGFAIRKAGERARAALADELARLALKLD